MKLILDDSVKLILRVAYEKLREQKHSILTAEHVLYVSLSVYPINRFLESLDVDVPILQKKLSEESKKIQSVTEANTLPYSGKIKDLRKSQSFAVLMESAFINAVREERPVVGIKDLLISFIELDKRHYASFQYSKYIDIKRMTEVLRYGTVSNDVLFKIDDTESITEEDLDMFESLFGDEDDDDEFEPDMYDDEPIVIKKQQESKLMTNLCTLAKEQGFDIFVGQELILHKIYEVLLRKKKNNVILVGDPGVGKTALIQEFAKRLVVDEVPAELKGYNLLSLDIVTLVAGTRYRGDFEDRVKQLIESLASAKNNILILDDIHSIISAGASAGNSNDFGDLIKPLLVDNVVRCIGLTTFDEFKTIEKEKSLLRRFNIVEMKEPSATETFTILDSIKEHYESFYNIRYSPEILQDIVDLSDRYISEKYFPDKAIDILDAIGSMLRIRQYVHTSKKKATHRARTQTVSAIEVSTKDVEEIISVISKRPIQSIQKDEISSLKNLEKRLAKKIFGQPTAIAALSKVIIRSKSGLREHSKPIASLLFVGPTGVGKTELSRQLALELGMHFHRFDMSEFQERHTVAKFIGSPPGYVGHEHGGVLIDSIRRYPSSLLLLDEIEKAHSDVFNLLLQIMDYATLTDSTGKKADFRNVILIMTSNAGAQESIQSVVGFEHTQLKGTQEIKDAVHNIFSPEFRNRLDETLVFSPLVLKNMKAIIVKELQSIRVLLLKRKINIEWSDEVIMYLVKKGFDSVYGARSVLRVIESEVKDTLAEIIIAFTKIKEPKKDLAKKPEHRTVLLTLNKNANALKAEDLSDKKSITSSSAVSVNI